MSNPDKTTISYVEEMAIKVMEESFELVPGDNDEHKKNWCANRLTDILESLDNLVPVIGVILDISSIDKLEKQAIHLLVNWAYDRMKIK